MNIYHLRYDLLPLEIPADSVDKKVEDDDTAFLHRVLARVE